MTYYNEIKKFKIKLKLIMIKVLNLLTKKNNTYIHMNIKNKSKVKYHPKN